MHCHSSRETGSGQAIEQQLRGIGADQLIVIEAHGVIFSNEVLCFVASAAAVSWMKKSSHQRFLDCLKTGLKRKKKMSEKRNKR